MDLETENRLAAMLMKEAAELRRQSEQEGVLAYLKKPTARGRPNSRFLTATVLGIQQANRAAEVDEMWRAREKELELNNKHNQRSRDENRSIHSNRDITSSSQGTRNWYPEVEADASTSWYKNKGVSENGSCGEDEGLRDEEIENFLHSRAKRGRGAVGSRMDETGPYLPPSPTYDDGLSTNPDVGKFRVLGPQKPSSLESSKSSDEELGEERRKKGKKSHSRSSDKYGREHKSRDKKKKRKEEKRRKKRKGK